MRLRGRVHPNVVQDPALLGQIVVAINFDPSKFFLRVKYRWRRYEGATSGE